MSYRPERLAHELKDLISSIIARELHDPRIGFATVTEVKVSRDLRHVRVFVSVFDEAARQKETIAASITPPGSCGTRFFEAAPAPQP